MASARPPRIAGHIAGLDVIRIINEPTAGCPRLWASAGTWRADRRVDLVAAPSLFRCSDINNGVFEVVATAGDTFRRRRTTTSALVDWLGSGFAKESQGDLRSDTMALQAAQGRGRKAKWNSRRCGETEINLPFIIRPAEPSLPLHRVVTRGKLEGADPGSDREDIRSAGWTMEDAASNQRSGRGGPGGRHDRMPKVQELVAESSRASRVKGVHPDEVVAMGAAIQGGCSDRRPRRRLTCFCSTSPHSLGIMVEAATSTADRPQHHGAHVEEPRLHHSPRTIRLR